MRNREAPAAYSLVLAGLGIALLAGLFTPQRWQVLAFIALLAVLMLRYLTPVSATVTDGAVTFRWPLRRVTLTAQNLVTARMLTGGVRALGLRRAGSVRFGVRLGGFSEPDALADALAAVIRVAPALSPAAREAALSSLHSGQAP